ncbi:MAG: hypothetical protein K2P58_09240 [Hyphomonadaceae bacterium]|nr:hypothetical protein [Hyphomonadaceae bacterium]
MLVGELADLLRQLEGEENLSPAQQTAVNHLLSILAPHRDMELEKLFDLLRNGFKPKRQARTAGQAHQPVERRSTLTASEFASALDSAFEDDAAFARLINEAKSNRGLTLAALKKTFSDLFGRSGNFRSKATRDDVLRKIHDERNIKVRNEKMGQMLGRKPVPAE